MSKPFELVTLIDDFARQQGIDLTHPDIHVRFATASQFGVKELLANPSFLQGHRAERLFEALVLSLDHFALLKREDTGKVHGQQPLRAPDFRLVLRDSEQWLVEVKNVYQREPLRQRTRLTASYMRSLRNYCELVGCPLRLAIHWARWGIWTVVSPDQFASPDGSVSFTMNQAIPVCELARLGDRTVGTTPPLRLVFSADLNAPRRLAPDDRAEMTIAAASLFSENRELTDPKERDFALLMLQFGEWDLDGPLPILENGELTGIQFIAEPFERSNTDERFEFIGSVSRMFSRYYASKTVKDRKVVRLMDPPRPDWLALLRNANQESSRLPLWLIANQPFGSEPRF